MFRPHCRLFVVVTICCRDAHSQRARALGPAYWECLVSEEDMRTPWISFIYKMRSIQRRCVGVSLECDVQSWHPSASEKITRARLNLWQLFLHRRAANDEADRVVGIVFFIRDLAIEQSAPPAGPDVVAILCVMNRFFETRSEELWSEFRGRRENAGLNLFRPNTSAEFLRECVHECVFVLLWANTCHKKVPIDNYRTNEGIPYQ